MKKYSVSMKHRIISMVMSLVMIITLLPATAFATETDTVNESDVSEENPSEEPSLEETLLLEKELCEENAVPEESTENSTVFDLGDGKKAIVYHGQDVRFEEEGELVDYDPALVEVEGMESEGGESLEAYKYENSVGDSSHYIPEKLDEDSQILMEKDDYSIKMLPLDNEIKDMEVVIDEEETLTPYESVEEKKTVAVYETEDEKYSYEYTSLNQGIKESIVLNEKPDSNIFRFSLELTGMYAELNEEENTILLKKEVQSESEEENEEEVLAVIDRPFMNDATGEAYSEELVYSIENQGNGKYVITLTVSENYLNSKERIYPVTIDPTATWKGTEDFLDAYVRNGESADTNFYDPDTRVMPSGITSKGTYRTYFKLPGIKNDLAGKYVDSAYLTVYETGNSDANQLVRLNRITESWTPDTITWNNKPAYNTAAYSNQFTTTGTQYKAHKVSITATIRNFLNSNNYPNYGLVMRNVTTDPDYAEFYGSRCAVATYRPKVVITYYDKPTKASSIYTTRLTNGSYVRSNYIKQGNRIYANWTGINSHNLSAVQYKFTGINGTAQPTSVSAEAVDLTSYRSTGSATASGTNVGLSYSPSLPTGVYRLYIRGKDAAGMFGTARYMTVYVDGAAPTLTNVNITPVTSESLVTGNATPTISWNATDTYFSKVTISVDGKTEETISTTAGAGTYTIPAGTFKKLEDTNEPNHHTVRIRAYDKAGRCTNRLLHYYVDVDGNDIDEIRTVPDTNDAKVSDNQTPTVYWETDTANLAKVDVLLNGEQKYTSTDANITSYQFEETDFPNSGNYTIAVKTTDIYGNVKTKDIQYYLDLEVPVFENIFITPVTSATAPSGNRSPIISWSIKDTSLASIEYSLNGAPYVIMKETNTQGVEENLTNKTGSFVMPSDVWGENGGTFTIRVKAVDLQGNESNIQELTYHLGTSTDYVPKNVAVTESYGKRLVTWSFDGYDSRKASYDIHRGNTAGFTPNVSTLLEANIDAARCLYIDPEILASGTYYYKIVVKDITGATAAQSGCSEAASVDNQITTEQFDNRLGQKSYLSYLDMGLPMGNLCVEESTGNLLYSQSEYSISNAHLSYGLDRIYNSRISRTSMFGTGWTDSYHKEIYTSGTDMYYVDSDGSSYKFELNNGSYECEETKEYTLKVTETGYEIETKDENLYKFDEVGRLVLESEPNGCTISYSYDIKGRLAYVISREDNASERKFALIYEGDSYLLHSVEDFAGTVYQYEYSGNELTKVSVGKKGELEDSVSYDYIYGNTGLLVGVYDGMGNQYSVAYNNGKVTSLSYPDGEKFTLTYKSESTEVEKYTPSNKKIHKEVITFNTATGKLLSFQDAKGKVTSYEYNTANPYLVSKVLEVRGYQTIDANGKIEFKTETVADTVYSYNDNDNIISEVSSDGSVTTYEYYDNNETNSNVTQNENLVKSEVTTKGEEVIANVEYAYDTKGNLTSTTDHIAETLEVNSYYVNTGNLETSILADTNIDTLSDDGEVETASEAETETKKSSEVSSTLYKYDEQGNVTEQETECAGVITESNIVYDAMGRVVESEENGIKTEIDYDFLGRDIQTTTTETGKAAVITTKVYNDNSVLISESSNIGLTKSYLYDNRNRLIKTTTSGTDIETNISTTSYGYGENVQIHDGKGSTTEAVTYKETIKDTAGNVIGITHIDTLGNTVKEISGSTYTDYSFDVGGNNVVTYEGNNSDNTFLLSMTLYDQEGRCFAEITNPVIDGESYVIGDDSVVTYTSYDTKGNIATETDALGVVTSYSYNEEGQLVSTDIANDGIDISVDYYTLENGQESVWVTDANNNLKKEFTDANGATVQTEDVSDTENGSIITTYSYDENGRKVAEIYGEQDKTQNVEQKLPYKEYTYEGTSDRIQTEVEYRLGGTLDGGTIYEYDTWNRLITVLHKEGNKTVCEYHYTYDVNGNVLTESVSYNFEPAKITAYEYDAEGRLVKITYPAQSELGVVNYKYDSNGKVTEILQNNKTVREYSYDGFERVIEITDYNEPGSNSYILKSYEYDELGRCVSMVYTEDGNAQKVLESYDYSYDKNSNIISETRISNLPSEDKVINETRDYIYDTYERLTQSTITDHTAADVQKITTYEYDPVGNRSKMTADGVVTEYSYNELNQLTESVSPTAEIKYTYDKYGNQIEESNETTDEVTEMDYSVSGEMVQLVKMNGTTTELIQENTYNQNGIRISRSQKHEGINIYFDKEYYYNNGVVAYTENGNTLSSANIQNMDGSVIGTYRSNVYHNYLKNIQGSTASIVDEDGETAAVYSYTDFGETEEVVEDTMDNEICYTGAIYDKDTGLYYMNARYYDAVTGRFISQDSYRGEIEDEGTWHLYAYCANNPINYVDPSGHKKKLVGAGLQVSVNASCTLVEVGVGVEIICFFSQIKTGVYAYWYGECGVSIDSLRKAKDKLYKLIKKEPQKLLSKPSFSCAICAMAIKSEPYNTTAKSYEGTFKTVAASALGYKGFISTGGGFRVAGAGKNYGNSGLSCSMSKYFYIGSVSKLFGSLTQKIKDKAKKYNNK